MSHNSLRIAVEGCGHGTLNSIYASIARACLVKGWDDIDLLIIGGDFQAARNSTDLNCMAVPMKYRELGDFHEYYSGQRRAPFLTIFVGGNHEASNHLRELYYGGWAAPNIYYLGAANVLRLGSLRIAGLSGIWKGYNYRKPHFERVPFNDDDVKSAYHVRELDVRKLLQLRSQVDVGLSHDWPQGIEWLGNWKWLFQRKDAFEADARSRRLGSVAARQVLDRLRPPHWFSAHLHIKYAATVDHSSLQNHTSSPGQSNGSSLPAPPKTQESIHELGNEDEIELDLDEAEPASPKGPTTKKAMNEDEIDLDDADIEQGQSPPPSNTTKESSEPQTQPTNGGGASTVPDDVRSQLPAAFSKPATQQDKLEPEPPHTINNSRTQFLALDKCLPRRDFLQLLELTPLRTEPTDQTQRPLRLTYDPEWLAITRAFAQAEPLQLSDPHAVPPRDKGRGYYARLIDAEREWVDENVTRAGRLPVPIDFATAAPVHDPIQPVNTREHPREYSNAHTAAFCSMLQIPNPFHASEEEREARMRAGPRAAEIRRSEGSRGGRGGRGGGGSRGYGQYGNRGGRGGFRGRGRGRGRPH